MSRSLLILILLLFPTSGGSVIAQEKSLDEIVESHIEAIGGKETIAKVKNFEILADVKMSGSFGTLEGTYKEVVDIERNRYFGDLDLGQQYRKADMVVGDSGKTKGTEGDRDMTTQELLYVRSVLGVSPLAIASESAGGGLVVEGTEEFNGKDCFKISLGSELQFFVNQETGHLEGRKIVGVATMIDKEREQVDGVWFPMRRDMKVDAQGVELDFKNRYTKVNVKIDESLFDDVGSSAKESKDYTPEQIMNFLDKDGDSRISKEEATASPELSPNFVLVDTDEDGFIDMAETKQMVAYSKNQKQNPVQPVKKGGLTTDQFIEKMDKDKDGKISKHEADAELQPLFNDIDDNGDGFVDEQEAKVVVDYVNGGR